MQNKELDTLIEKFEMSHSDIDKKIARTKIDIYCRENKLENPLAESKIAKIETTLPAKSESELLERQTKLKNISVNYKDSEILEELEEIAALLADFNAKANTFTHFMDLREPEAIKAAQMRHFESLAYADFEFLDKLSERMPVRDFNFSEALC